MSVSSSETDLNPVSFLRFAVGTDVGRRREENQDSYGVIEGENLRFYIVADGMGGAKGGATASAESIRVVESEIKSASEVGEIVIARAIQRANGNIFEHGSGDEALAGMGTTFVGIAFIGTELFITNVGDSRAYRIRSGKIRQLTNDHTLVKELLRSGAISPEQADNHPVAHMLTRSLGPTPEVEVDCWLAPDGPAEKDIYLLCSDGLYNLVQDQEMLSLLQQFPLDDAVQKLIDLANERGGTDNITVILAEVGEGYPKKPEDFPELDYSGPPPHVSTAALATPIELPMGDVAEDQAPDQGWERVKGYERTEEHRTLDLSGSDSLNGMSNGHLASAVTEALERTSGGESIRPKRHLGVTIGLSVALVVFGVAIGTVYPRLFKSDSLDSSENIAVNPLAAVVVQSALDLKAYERTLSAPDLIYPSLLGDFSNQSASRESSENRADQYAVQIDSVTKRRNSLLEHLADIDRKLAVLDQPLSGDTGKGLKDIIAKSEDLRVELVSVRTELDTSTRKLALFFGRRQRLQSIDPVDLASEVAVSSQAVRQDKEEFERATWGYLKEVEVWRFNPQDKALTSKVSELGRTRERARRVLAESVKRAIDDTISSSEQEISNLTAKRDGIQGALDQLDRDQAFIKVLLTGNPQAKDRQRQELEHEREITKSELGDLERIMPDLNKSMSADASVEER